MILYRYICFHIVTETYTKTKVTLNHEKSLYTERTDRNKEIVAFFMREGGKIVKMTTNNMIRVNLTKNL